MIKQKRFYNIQTGYGLAEIAVNAVYGNLDGFVLFECYVDHKSINFIKKIGKSDKRTLLHVFLEALEEEMWETLLGSWVYSDPEVFPDIKATVQRVYAKLPNWFIENEIDQHPVEMQQIISTLVGKTASAAFEILFNDLEFLYEFQLRIKEVIEREDTPHSSDFYDDSGYIKRQNYNPRWLERAVFFRDQGRCQDCYKDVTGEVYLSNVYHLDHILPLADGGSNDPTNFQLLCENCNLKKGRRRKRPTNRKLVFSEKE